MSEAIGKISAASKFELPSGWKRVRLGDVTRKIGSGITPSGGQSSYVASGVPLIRSQNVHLGRFEPMGLAFITAEQDSAMIESRVSPGDVLLNITGASIGRVCLAPAALCPANVNQHVAIIRPDSSVSSEFLAAYLASPIVQNFIWGSQSGATRQALTKAQIVQFEIPVPPLAEQRRIAAVLRAKLAEVERARATLAAQLAAAESLPAAHLRAAFDSTDARAWPWLSIEKLDRKHDALADGPFGSHLKTEHYTESGARVVRLQNIGNGVFLGQHKAFVSLGHFNTLKRHHVRDGDVLVAALGDGARPAGRACRVPKDFGPGLVKADCFRVRLPPDSVDPAFLVGYFNSPASLTEIGNLMRGATRPRVTLDIMRKRHVPIPDLATQRRLAAELKEKLATAAALRAALETQAAALEKLPAALLREAFAGRL